MQQRAFSALLVLIFRIKTNAPSTPMLCTDGPAGVIILMDANYTVVNSGTGAYIVELTKKNHQMQRRFQASSEYYILSSLF